MVKRVKGIEPSFRSQQRSYVFHHLYQRLMKSLDVDGCSDYRLTYRCQERPLLKIPAEGRHIGYAATLPPTVGALNEARRSASVHSKGNALAMADSEQPRTLGKTPANSVSRCNARRIWRGAGAPRKGKFESCYRKPWPGLANRRSIHQRPALIWHNGSMNAEARFHLGRSLVPIAL